MGIGIPATAWASPEASPGDSSENADSASQSSATPVRADSVGGRAQRPAAVSTRAAGSRGAAEPAAQRVDNAQPDSAHAVPLPASATAVSALPDRPTPSVSATFVAPALPEGAVSRLASAAVASEAPVIIAAPDGAPAPVAAAQGVESVVVSLLATGSGLGGPLESPLAWAVLAAVRRQYGRAGAAASAVPRPAAAQPNQPPVITGVVLGTPSALTGALTLTVTATDPEANTLTYSATTTSTGSVTKNSATVFTYTPTVTARHTAAKGVITTGTVTITVTDSLGASTSQAVSVPITPKNAVPTATKSVGLPNSITGVVTGKVTGSDADKDVLTYTGSGTTGKGGTVTVTASTGAFTYTPTAAARHAAARIGAPAADKVDNFTVTITDGYGGTLNVPVTVAIGPKNIAPTAGTPTIGAPGGSTGVVTGAVSATDSDADSLTYTASKPLKGTVAIDRSTGAFTFTPSVAARHAAGKPGALASAQYDTFTVTVTDGYGGTATKSLTVSILPFNPYNTAPVAGQPVVNSPNVFTGVVTGIIPATDAEDTALIYTVTTKPARGIVIVNGVGGFSYTPTYAARQNAATSPTDTFAVTITDGYGGSAGPVSVTVDIAALNAASQGVDTSGWLDWTEAPYSGKRPTTDWVPQLSTAPNPILQLSSFSGVEITSSSNAYVSYSSAGTSVPIPPLVVAAYYIPPAGAYTLSPFTNSVYLSQAGYLISTGYVRQVIEFTADRNGAPFHGVLTVDSNFYGFNMYLLASPTAIWADQSATLAAIAQQLVTP